MARKRLEAACMIRADLHIHSCTSEDSSLSPYQIVKVAMKRGLNCVAVTDHNTARGGLETLREARLLKDFFVVPGVEVKTEVGDVILLFVEEEVRTRSIFDVLDYSKDVDALTILPHPYRKHKAVERLAREVCAIEVLNARTDRCANLKAYKLASELGKPMVGGSDAHTAFEIGRALTIVNGFTVEDLRKSILDGKTYVVGSWSPPVVHALSFAVKLSKRLRAALGR